MDLFNFAVKIHYNLRNDERLKKYSRIKLSEIPKLDELSFDNNQSGKLKLYVVNKDPIEILTSDFQDGYKSIIFCPTSSTSQSCGFWESGKRNFEENLCYRSTLPLALPQVYDPKLTSSEVILANQVYFFRDHKYKTMPTIKAGVLIGTELNRPMFSVENDYKKMEDLLSSVFRIAFLEKYDSIIMPTFGCYNTDSDPNEVAEITNQVIKKCQHLVKKVTILATEDKLLKINPTIVMYRKKLENITIL